VFEIKWKLQKLKPEGQSSADALSISHHSLERGATFGSGPGAWFPIPAAELCRIYWYPIYASVPRRGNDAEEAQEQDNDPVRNTPPAKDVYIRNA
jgi:hypothetical protein